MIKANEGNILCKCGHIADKHYNDIAECKKCKCNKFAKSKESVGK